MATNQLGNFDKALALLKSLEQMMNAAKDPGEVNLELALEDRPPPESGCLQLLSKLEQLEKNQSLTKHQRAVSVLKEANLVKFAQFAQQFQSPDCLPYTERIGTISSKMKSLAKDLEWILEALNKPKMCKMDAKYHEAASRFINLVSSDLIKFESEYSTLQLLVESIQMPSKECLYLNENKFESFFQQINQSINNMLHFQNKFTESLAHLNKPVV